MVYLFPYIQDDISQPSKHFTVKASHFLQAVFVVHGSVVQVISTGGTYT